MQVAAVLIGVVGALAYLGSARVFEQPTDGTLSFEQAKESLNKFTTTLHAINSAIIKLGKLTVAKKVAPSLGPMPSPVAFPQSQAPVPVPV